MFARFDNTPSISKNLKFAASSLAILMCTACGGSSSSSSSASSPPAVVNQPPVIAISKMSVVTEGQPFTLDASGSSDSNGDTLSFSWRQTSGPNLELGSATSPTLALTAPLLDANETVMFELSVSDGALTTTSEVSLRLEDVKVVPAISQSTDYGTGGPQTPAETVPDPSLYEGRKPLNRIIGLTTENDGGYRVHWTASGGGHDMPVSSQAFTVGGEKTGEQVDGVFLGGDQGTVEEDGRSFNRYIFGVTFATVQSDETLFNLNAKIAFEDGGITLGYTSYRGVIQGEIDGFGDQLIEQSSLSQKTMGGAFSPVGQDNIMLVLSERTTENADDPDARIFMTAWVTNKFGQTLSHDLGEYASNGTTNKGNRMAATSYGEDSFMVAWAQDTEDDAYDVKMQRANEDGILFGEHTTVSENTDGAQLYPLATTLTNGNMLVTWVNIAAEEDETFQIRGRMVRPDGTFVSGDLIIMSDIPKREGFIYDLTALNSNDVMLTWHTTTDEGADLRAVVLDSDGEVASNEFLIATGGEAENLQSFQATTLPDNRMVMGWFNNHPHAESEEKPDTSHTVSFYPVGKE